MNERERFRGAEQSGRNREQNQRDWRNGSFTISQWCQFRQVSRADSAHIEA
jgi:hypothetical protein